MKIGNEYVEIKIENKVYRKQNMILNTYLKKIFQAQLDTEHNTAEINTCFLKLDTPIENVTYDSELNGRNDFDIILLSSGNLTQSLITTKNSAKVIYNFKNRMFMFKKSDGTWAGTSTGNFDMFDGRKITAIGFGVGVECVTFLDTSNMNIIINSSETFMFTRVDNITSDGEAKDIEYPLHLINDIADKDAEWKQIDIGGRTINVKETTMAKLYSVGFGVIEGTMENEYLIENVEIERDDTSITFELSRSYNEQIYPSLNIYPSTTLYPTKENTRYLIFKYKLYKRYYNEFIEEYVITELDEYYTMNMLNNNFGNLEIKLKLERE